MLFFRHHSHPVTATIAWGADSEGAACTHGAKVYFEVFGVLHASPIGPSLQLTATLDTEEAFDENDGPRSTRI